jgi:hypothetical protein
VPAALAARVRTGVDAFPIARLRSYGVLQAVIAARPEPDVHEYDLAQPAPHVEDLLDEIDHDPTHIFWGSPRLRRTSSLEAAPRIGLRTGPPPRAPCSTAITPNGGSSTVSVESPCCGSRDEDRVPAHATVTATVPSFCSDST